MAGRWSVVGGEWSVARLVVAVACATAAFQPSAYAQRGRGGPPAPPSPRAAAPVDLTGQWVSLITEDWRYRQFTPPKGDYPGLPLSPAAQRIAEGWDPARDALYYATSGAGVARYRVGAGRALPLPVHVAGGFTNLAVLG